MVREKALLDCLIGPPNPEMLRFAKPRLIVDGEKKHGDGENIVGELPSRLRELGHFLLPNFQHSFLHELLPIWKEYPPRRSLYPTASHHENTADVVHSIDF